MEKLWVGGAERASCVLWIKVFFELGGEVYMDTLVCEEGNLVFNPGVDRNPVGLVEYNAVMFVHYCRVFKAIWGNKDWTS